jgi:Asp-tRNA(Asn)/Glu-tRNA(Gln) amidotransferase C subunit
MKKSKKFTEVDNPSYEGSWDACRNEQVKTITTLLSHIFKAEDEVLQMKESSRLLRLSPIDVSERQQEMRHKLSLIRKQISEYEQVLKLSLERIENALERIDANTSKNKEPMTANCEAPFPTPNHEKKLLSSLISPIKKILKKFS